MIFGAAPNTFVHRGLKESTIFITIEGEPMISYKGGIHGFEAIAV